MGNSNIVVWVNFLKLVWLKVVKSVKIVNLYIKEVNDVVFNILKFIAWVESISPCVRLMWILFNSMHLKLCKKRKIIHHRQI